MILAHGSHVISCVKASKPFEITRRPIFRMNTACFIQGRGSRPALGKLFACTLFGPNAQIKGVWIFSAGELIGRLLSLLTLFLNIKFR